MTNCENCYEVADVLMFMSMTTLTPEGEAVAAEFQAAHGVLTREVAICADCLKAGAAGGSTALRKPLDS